MRATGTCSVSSFLFIALLLVGAVDRSSAFAVKLDPITRRISNRSPCHYYVRRHSIYYGLPAARASLITETDTWGNWAVLSGMAALSHILGKRTAIGRLLGAPVTAMALTFVSASIGVLHPGGTPAAKSLQTLSLQLATPLVLLGADLRDALGRCGALLISFALAASSTIAASVVGWSASGSALQAALGRDGLVIAAALVAKNIGGGINYMAVCQSLNASPTAVAAGLCVDNLFALLYFPISSAMANNLPDVELPNHNVDDAQTTESNKTRMKISTTNNNITVQSITTVAWVSCVLLWLGERLGGVSGALPVCTVLSVLLASFAPSQIFSKDMKASADCLGLMFLYLFFSTAGSPGVAVAESVRASLVPLGLFLTGLYSIHGLLLVAFCFLGKNRGAFRKQRLLVASSASIGGPATAFALAETAHWKSLAVPSVIVGNVGYAIGTFCGLLFHRWFV